MDTGPHSPQAVPTQPEGGHPTPAEAASAYLAAFYAGDFGHVRTLLAEDFTFTGPFVQVRGRDPFLDSAAGLKPIVRGHRLLRQWVDGGEVCSWYEVDLHIPVKSGTVAMSEWHTVRAGRLTSGRVLFDAAAFRAFLPDR